MRRPLGAECSAPATKRGGQGALIGLSSPGGQAGGATGPGPPKTGPRRLLSPRKRVEHTGAPGGGCCCFVPPVITAIGDILKRRVGTRWGRGAPQPVGQWAPSGRRARAGESRGRDPGPEPRRREHPPDSGTPGFPGQRRGEAGRGHPPPRPHTHHVEGEGQAEQKEPQVEVQRVHEGGLVRVVVPAPAERGPHPLPEDLQRLRPHPHPAPPPPPSPPSPPRPQLGLGRRSPQLPRLSPSGDPGERAGAPAVARAAAGGGGDS